MLKEGSPVSASDEVNFVFNGFEEDILDDPASTLMAMRDFEKDLARDPSLVPTNGILFESNGTDHLTSESPLVPEPAKDEDPKELLIDQDTRSIFRTRLSKVRQESSRVHYTIASSENAYDPFRIRVGAELDKVREAELRQEKEKGKNKGNKSHIKLNNSI